LWAFILVTSLFFLWGFAYGLLDVLNKHFQNVLGVTKLQSTGLQVAYFGVGYFLFSPVAAECLKRFGYKKTIIMGLSLYALGAVLFWPVAKASLTSKNKGAIFGGFVVCTSVIACGLATLETSANSYVSVMPPIDVANFRLQFSQSFNGVASFTGPLIASKYFFSGEHANDLTTVQYVYLAVALLGVAVATAFVFTPLPEVSEAALQAEAEALADATEGEVVDRGFWRTRAPFGFVTQFMYVGAQVTIGTFFINYAHENGGLSDAKASQFLSYALILFTVGRFFGTALLAFISASLLLAIYSVICCVLIALIATLHGMGGVICLMVIMFFESIMYPVIFVTGTAGLGRHTRRGAGLLVMGVSGGAVFPPMQAAIADAVNTRVSFWICLPCFVEIALFGLWAWNKDGRKFGAAKAPARRVQADEEEYPAGELGFRADEKKDETDYLEKKSDL
jgi:FHS family L-fucose permease-like MFS transporter